MFHFLIFPIVSPSGLYFYTNRQLTTAPDAENTERSSAWRHFSRIYCAFSQFSLHVQEVMEEIQAEEP